ncbi:MAG: curved DNA-binding protein CbpA, partial [Myxococcota bacterium]
DGIRKAYHQLVKLLHPDRLKRRDLGELERPARDVFKALTDGYQVLSNPDSRTRYDYERQSSPRKPKLSRPSPTTQPPVNEGEPQVPKGITEKELLEAPVERFSPAERGEIARWLLHGGASLFSKADYTGAERYFERAMALDPTRPIYALRLGWAIFRNTARPDNERAEVARPYLESAGARDAYNPEARYALAQFLKEFGSEEAYRRELEAVLRCDESHPRARRELEQLGAALQELRNRRAASSSGSSGLRNRLGRLFSRPGANS